MTPIVTDKALAGMTTLDLLVFEENARQLKKWGVRTHSWFEWLAYLTEETGEVAKAVSEYVYRQGSLLEIRKEAIQVATLALKMAEMTFSEEAQ